MTQLDPKKFFLGRIFDPAANKTTQDPLLFDPSDLTIHGVITGMTGSGKTGLGVGFLEEAGMKGIPAIIIDPKGDLTNLLLHFPDLLPQDFEPWIDPEVARRENKPVASVAQETAEKWKTGLANWGYGREELLTLKEKVQFSVFTPGSSAGKPVNILSSFAAPEVPWDQNREVLREKIAVIVTALLGLVGIDDIDPLRSREHILLSNILEHSWSTGKSLELTDLILAVQKPAFDRLGAFPLESFYPEKDRFGLAMLLNNFLATPSFQTWLEGQSLDIGAMLYGSGNRPRHNIFYLAHLSETERMFFVTLLFSEIEAWMRTQRGTSNLRLLIYFDEIMGYLPPVANPPSRTIILRMLKQARAFGVGLLLSTQNPVDLDYKALSNMGTWIIGRLQTEQDKNRLLDGLQSAAGGTVERGSADKLISQLGKRVFLYHNVSRPGLKLFETRFALNYLAGPLTRVQIPALSALAGEEPAAAALNESTAGPAYTRPGQPTASSEQAVAVKTAASNKETAGKLDSLSSRPPVPAGIQEYFWPSDLGVSDAAQQGGLAASGPLEPSGLLYKPALLAQSEIYYLSRKQNIDFSKRVTSLVGESDIRVVRWENYLRSPVDEKSLQSDPLPSSRFSILPGWLSDAKRMKSMQDDFSDWLVRSSSIRVQANETLKVYAGPETSTAQFREMCSTAAKKLMEEEEDKVSQTFQKKLDALEEKIRKQTSEVEEQKSELSSRRLEELGTGGEFIFGLFQGRKKSISSSISKRRMTSQAKANLEQEEDDLKSLQKQLDALEVEMKEALDAVKERWADTATKVSEVPLTPLKKDIFVELFGLVWLPYYLIKVGQDVKEVAAFKTAS